MSKEKIIQAMEDGTEVVTCKQGWNPKEVADVPALIQGWAPNSPSHHSISYGMLLACKKAGVEGAYIGDFLAENDKGETIKVPVFDPIVINGAMEDAFIDAHSLDVVKIATNRTGAAKKLTAIKDQVSKLDPAVLEAIKESNKELYDTLTGGVKKEEEPEPEEKPGEDDPEE